MRAFVRLLRTFRLTGDPAGVSAERPDRGRVDDGQAASHVVYAPCARVTRW